MDDFEDEYFNGIETSGRVQNKPRMGHATKVINSNRRQQEMSRNMKRRDFMNPPQRLVFNRGPGRTIGDSSSSSSSSSSKGSGLNVDTDVDDVDDKTPAIGKGAAENGFFGHNPIDVNVKITKERETVPEPKISNEELKYKVTKHVEHNRDLYFVRLVAGSLKRSFESMINVEQRYDTGTTNLNGKVVINVKYFYNNELLHGWATIIEKVKKMITTYTHGWDTSENIHQKLIDRDTTCVAFARYVAFVIMTESNTLIPRNRTRYSIDNDAQLEDQLVVNLMKSLDSEYNVLKEELISRFL